MRRRREQNECVGHRGHSAARDEWRHLGAHELLKLVDGAKETLDLLVHHCAVRLNRTVEVANLKRAQLFVQ